MAADKINWNQFVACCNDDKSVNLRFEDLCRQLFWEEFLADNESPEYIHNNPNHPGLESEPIYSEKLNKWIGFQAKYFSNQTDYTQIEKSVDHILIYYKEKLNTVYLFSNKSLTTTSKSYKRIEEKLNKEEITLVPITNEAILDLVRKYPKLALYYFKNKALTKKWFQEHESIVEAELGDRFNKRLNVSTEAEDLLSIFLHDEKAAKQLNDRKSQMLERAKEYSTHFTDERCQKYLKKLIETVSSIKDITVSDFNDVVHWNTKIHKSVEKDLMYFSQQIKNITEDLESLDRNKHKSPEKKKEKYNRAIELNVERNKYLVLFDLAGMLKLKRNENQALNSSALFITGRAGIGKSHLLAAQTHYLIDKGFPVILLLGGDCTSDESMIKQIEECLRGASASFEELLDILDQMGKLKGRVIPIMIDAINESWKPDLWKKALPTILQKTEQLANVKLVISYRSEYEEKFADKNLFDRYSVFQYKHQGFERNTIDSVRQFLNYYQIPFPPEQILIQDITNPLFLTLYCQTYEGDSVDVSVLYDRLLNKQNLNINNKLHAMLETHGCEVEDKILQQVVSELAEYILNGQKKFFSKEDVAKLAIWSSYGFKARPYITKMIQEGILHSGIYENEETLHFAYDQMNDIFCARAAVKKYRGKETIKKYLKEEILKPNEFGQIKYGNNSLFASICAVYAEKYSEECIDILESVQSEDNKRVLFRNYIDSLQWRNRVYITVEEFVKLCIKYKIDRDEVLSVFINNSIKEIHPLNAEGLHRWLMCYSLPERDYIWTTYINNFSKDCGERIVQLVTMFNRGENLDFANQRQAELMLVLFGWCLTASNRWFRDITSKAMIEILRKYFQLAEKLLRKFENVNDPYVLQRIYGVVFGACCKREKNNEQEYQSLCEYVYKTIFEQEKVYPDILLRDYARQIIDRFLYEFPEYDALFECSKIAPPYNSDPIVAVEQDYLSDKNNFTNGESRILMSIRFDEIGKGGYGDFGRYVYQSALSDFDVDQEMIFNYSMHYILEELGYNKVKELAEYDKDQSYYERHRLNKIERIGKKYQWITFYNVLARVTDHCQMKPRYSPEAQVMLYKGPWEPYVRDFDPTLNNNFMLFPNAPQFDKYEENTKEIQNEIDHLQIESEEEIDEWSKAEDNFFKSQIKQLCPQDADGQQWVVLQRYFQVEHRIDKDNKWSEWNSFYGYFTTEENKEKLLALAKKNIDFATNELRENLRTYTTYSREFPWSKSMTDLEAWSSQDIKVWTGETVKKEEIPLSYEQTIAEITLMYKENTELELDDLGKTKKLEIKKEYPREEKVYKTISNIFPASLEFLWEEQYDASKDEAIVMEMPSIDFLRTMKLKQLQYDGYFFDTAGKLAAFDTSLTGQDVGFVVRKDLLDSYLLQKHLKLVWVMLGDKEKKKQKMLFCDWEGLYEYNAGEPKGCQYIINEY